MRQGLEGAETKRLPQIRLYRDWLAEERGLSFASYEEMWAWSVADLEAFWRSIWDYFDLQSATPFDSALSIEAMPGAVWFDGATVNYAQQVFRHADAADAACQPAIIAENERGEVTTLSWAELRRQSAALALELRAQGVERGDRVAAYLPNIPAAVTGLLACASIGAVWSLCSPDMGTRAVLDRLRQIEPKALIAVDGVRYAGKDMDRSATVAEIGAALPGLNALLVVESGLATAAIADAIDFAKVVARTGNAVEAFEPAWLPFDHPLWILYSSGTTGLPKAIVHGHGGVILASAAGQMHFDLGASYSANNFGDRFHWFSATGWVMWNIQVGGLLSGTTICLFDGSPSGPKGANDWSVLWRFAARHRVNWMGGGAAFFISCHRAGLDLGATGALANLRALGTTGSPLPPDVQRWGSAQFAAVDREIWWCNVSGGTEIAAAFMAGNPELPDAPGRLQCRHLGAAIEAWDDHGQPLIGAVGELVCTRPFPSMPLYFWGDADGSRYRDAYFAEWPGVWRHGDWLTIDADGSCTISGRSDATINRHGLRMGTAEIYGAVERSEDIVDSMLIDVDDAAGDSRLLLFVVPAPDREVDDALIAEIARAIRESLSPRFVPDRVLAAPAIPYTLSGKKLELPVKRLFAGWAAAKVVNADAIANPEILPWYVAQAEAWRWPGGSIVTVEDEVTQGEGA